MTIFRDIALFLLLSFLWGTAFVAISAGLEYIPPVLFASIRYDIAAILMLVYAAVGTSAWIPRTRSDWLSISIGSILVIALYNALLFTGQQVVTSGVAAILIAVNPILATGFSRVFLRDARMTRLGIVGLFLGFVGVGLVVAPNPSELSSAHLLASGFVLAAATCVALGSVLMQRTDSGLSTEATVAWSCLFGAIILHGISLGISTESLDSARFSMDALGAVLYLAIFASAIGYFLYFHLLDRLGAVEINLVSYAAPVFAALFGWLLLGEVITGQTVTGFLVIFLGFVLLKHEVIAGAFRLH